MWNYQANKGLCPGEGVHLSVHIHSSVRTYTCISAYEYIYIYILQLELVLRKGHSPPQSNEQKLQEYLAASQVEQQSWWHSMPSFLDVVDGSRGKYRLSV